MVHDSAGCGPSFRSMWAAIPFHVVQDSAKWSTIPVITKMRTASQRNPGPLPVESPDRFPWNHRTASPGITGPHRPEYAPNSNASHSGDEAHGGIHPKPNAKECVPGDSEAATSHLAIRWQLGS